jgi:ABC-type transport system involved in multi-copper enzyme maturation permease subunit
MATAALRPRFIGSARAEVMKVLRQLVVWVMLGVGVVLLGVVVLGVSSANSLGTEVRQFPTSFLYDALDIYGTVFQIGSGIFILVIASRLFAMEYSAGTVRILYARGQGRLQLLLAKTAVLLLGGAVLLAGYALVAGAILVLTVQANGADGVHWLTHLPGSAWQDLGRYAVVQGVSMGCCILIAAAAAALGRSLAFAMAASLALFPVDNFLTIILALAARATRHDHPWNDISAYLLGPNLNVLLKLWEPTHRARPAFAMPLVTVNLNHVLAVIGVFAAGFAVVAVVRTVRPDVLE